jgi:hypothetical protein
MRRRLPSFFGLAGWLALVFAPAGCTVKYSSQVSGKDAAYVVARAPVWVVSIDGRKVHGGFGHEKRYVISPGEHRINVAFSDSEIERVHTTGYQNYQFLDPATGIPGRVPVNYPDQTVVTRIRSTQNIELPFTAVAGHTYYVKSGRTRGFWQPHLSESQNPVFMDPPP